VFVGVGRGGCTAIVCEVSRSLCLFLSLFAFQACEVNLKKLVYALAGVAAALAVTGLYYGGFLALPASLQQSSVVGTLRQLDTGTLRVLWSTFQIVHSVRELESLKA